jgi:D-alanyl-D-alanine carboxypeptidase
LQAFFFNRSFDTSGAKSPICLHPSLEASSSMSSSVAWKAWRILAATVGALAFSVGGAIATPYLVVDAESGQALIENDSTAPWFPASVTKLMTTYVALSAVRDGKLTMDTPLTMSLRAARMAPSKMGFRPGTEVTLDNALKMLMVKSPNDVAVMIAEGISGSVEAFADDMNAAALHLGLKESHFVNPNGLHDPNHYSSARDMAIIGRALFKEFPDHADLFDIGAIQLGNQIIPNHNGLLGRYPGADGMKTGFTCPAGFNVVASATRNGRRLIVVVMGSPSPRQRNLEAAELFDRGFAQSGGGVALESLPASSVSAPRDMRDEICSRRNRAAVLAAAAEEERVFAAPAVAAGSLAGRGMPAPAAAPAPAVAAVAPTLLAERVHFEPIPVFVGPKPGWTGPVLAARPIAGEPTEASAYTSEKSPAYETATEPSAPVALQGAVHIPEPYRTRARARTGHVPVTTTVAREHRLAAVAVRRWVKKRRVN